MGMFDFLQNIRNKKVDSEFEKYIRDSLLETVGEQMRLSNRFYMLELKKGAPYNDFLRRIMWFITFNYTLNIIDISKGERNRITNICFEEYASICKMTVNDFKSGYEDFIKALYEIMKDFWLDEKDLGEHTVTKEKGHQLVLLLLDGPEEWWQYEKTEIDPSQVLTFLSVKSTLRPYAGMEYLHLANDIQKKCVEFQLS